MANQYFDLVALTGIWGIPDEMHDEFMNYNVHAEFMVEKSQQSGELELVHFWWAKNENCRSN